MGKRDWKIIYSDYSGVEKRAVELLSREMGAYTVRDDGIFTLHVLACEKRDTLPDTNAVIIGTYAESSLMRSLVGADEVPADGFLFKAIDHPKNESLKLVLITANDARSLFYGAVYFVDDYFVLAAPRGNFGRFAEVEHIFAQEHLPDHTKVSSPKCKTRSIFTWGHVINDYHAYIDAMARLRFNQLILWNDYVPINADDVADYAHSYGIELIWGFAWGWQPGVRESVEETLRHLPEVKEQIIRRYRDEYLGRRGDGIYFQSFTEFTDNVVDGVVIADVVTKFVNEVAQELWKITPDLHLQFGLHAPSVRNNLQYIANVDERIEIVWEDCGAFPYDYNVATVNEADFAETEQLTRRLIELRKVNPLGLVYKGQMTMDWEAFVPQAGPYVLGMNHERVIECDHRVMDGLWKDFQADWLIYAEYAHRLANSALQQTGGNINMNVAGTFSAGITFPFALTAELFWDCTDDYREIVKRVAKRRTVRM